MTTTIKKWDELYMLNIFPQNEDVKSATSAGTPAYYTSDETEKRDNSHAFTSSDVECFKIEEKKKKKVLRKRQ